MNRIHRLSLALLAGCAIIWLASIAVALVATLPFWSSVFRFFRSHGIPVGAASQLLMAYLPVLLAALLVGLVAFRLDGHRVQLFLATAAPFVLFGLYQNLSLLLPFNALAAVLQTAEFWHSVAVVPIGLALAVWYSKATRAAA